MITCPTCGAENRPEAKVCRLCSVPLEAAPEAPALRTERIDTESTIVFSVAPIICPACNAENEEGWVFCQSCGAKLKQPQPAPKASPANAPIIPPGQVQFHPAVEKVNQVTEKTNQPNPVANQPRRPVNDMTLSSGSLTSKCPNCSNPLPPRSQHCPKCGTVLSADHTVAMSSYRPGSKARLRLIVDDGNPGEEFDLGSETVLGRVTGDITFPDDDYMSGRHARIIRKGTQFLLTDEASRNGTFIRITGDVELKPGDMILVGKQLFRFEV
jgi:predicted amidophosphoribosyltransferase